MTHFNPKLAELVREGPALRLRGLRVRLPGPALRAEDAGAGAGRARTASRPSRQSSTTSPGRSCCEGIRRWRLRQFGLMARTVLSMWGIARTDDFGEIVFNLIEAELMSKTDEDSRDDFRDVYDLDEALVHGFRIQLDEVR